MVSEKQQTLWGYVKEREKAGVTQPDIISFFQKSWNYSSRISASVAIGRMLAALEEKKKLRCEQVQHEGKGSGLNMNVWFPC